MLISYSLIATTEITMNGYSGSVNLSYVTECYYQLVFVEEKQTNKANMKLTLPLFILARQGQI